MITEHTQVYPYYHGKSVLITGGLGFLGSNLAIRLTELGARVTILDCKLPESGANDFNVEPVHEQVRVVLADVGDRSVTDSLVVGKDLIFNLAGTLSHTDSMRDPYQDLHCNCIGHIRLLDSVRTHAPQARILYAATRAQYGRPQYNPVDEKHPMISADANGINKAAGEAYHFLYGHAYGLFTTSLRITNTYGPRHQMRHHRQGVLNWFVRRVLDGDPILVYGDGMQIRDMNHVDDVVAAMLVTLACDRSRGEAFNLGGNQVRLKELAELLVRLNGSGKVEIIPYPKDSKEVEIGDYIADTSKIEKLIGWKAKVPVAEGFAQTLEYYRQNRGEYWG
ncbi:NAD-dependent epimerase/dehydratase family protein [Bdellovibrionota bacterium FG-1]